MDGHAILNPLSHFLCDIYIHYFEEKLFHLVKRKCCMRYVDDIFAIVERNCDLVEQLSIVNFVDHCIQFTLKEEYNNFLPFLIIHTIPIIGHR